MSKPLPTPDVIDLDMDLCEVINTTEPNQKSLHFSFKANNPTHKELADSIMTKQIGNDLKEKYKGESVIIEEEKLQAKKSLIDFKSRKNIATVSNTASLDFNSILSEYKNPPVKKPFPTFLFKHSEKREDRAMEDLKSWKKKLPVLPEKREPDKLEDETKKKIKCENLKKSGKKTEEIEKFDATEFIRIEEEKRLAEQRRLEVCKEIQEKNRKEHEYRLMMNQKIMNMHFEESEEARTKREFDKRKKNKDNLNDFFHFLLQVPIFSKKIQLKTALIPVCFRNGEDYIQAFQNAFFCEVFQEIVSAVEQRDLKDYSEITIDLHDTRDLFAYLNFSEGIKENFNRSVHSEDLVVLFSADLPSDEFDELIERRDPSLEFSLAFVEKCEKDKRLKLKTLKSNLGSVLRHGQSKARAVIIETCTTMLREFKMIRLSEFNELSEFIYNPRKLPIVIRKHFFDGFVSTLMKFHNESQFDAIMNACCIKSGIYLLQGPPGTGKTHTIRGIISTLMTHSRAVDQSQDSIKILVCAPSNTAVDEIANRVLLDKLYKHNGCPIENISYLRLGNQKKAFFDMRELKKNQKEMPDAVKKITLSNLVQETLKMTDLFFESEDFKKLEQEKEIIKASIESYKAQKNNAKIVELHEHLSKKTSQMYKEKFSNKLQKDAVLSAEKRIIQSSQIIFTTLSGSGGKDLDLLMNQIDVVIIDESCQSVELSSLIPLRLNPKVAILVGDPKQLPATTFSSRSFKNLYNRSLFERLMAGGNKVDILTVQYRMSKEICGFASEHFYLNLLKTFEEIDSVNVPNWIKATGIHVFDLETSQESRSQSETSLFNEQECLFIKDLYWHLNCLHGSKLGIGIISPYKKQVQFIKDCLHDQFEDWRLDIEVNTIDGFQGREKDVIIISTVRSEDSIGFLADARRLNVAITRAKFALWVIGKVKCLSSNLDWKKLVEFSEKAGKMKKCKSFEEVAEVFTPDSIRHTYKQGFKRQRRPENFDRFSRAEKFKRKNDYNTDSRTKNFYSHRKDWSKDNNFPRNNWKVHQNDSKNYPNFSSNNRKHEKNGFLQRSREEPYEKRSNSSKKPFIPDKQGNFSGKHKTPNRCKSTKNSCKNLAEGIINRNS